MKITCAIVTFFSAIFFMTMPQKVFCAVLPEKKVDSIEVAQYIKWFPAIRQVKMRDAWLKKYKMGEWQFTGTIDATNKTVVTPQAGANYGYSWFNISKAPIVISMPKYDKYYSLTIYDMNHFMQVKVSPTKPVVIRLASQKSPIDNAIEIVLQTYQGLAFTRQVIVDNEKEVMNLANRITIKGGGGDFPFVLPYFKKAVQIAGLKKINDYLSQGNNIANYFVSPYEGGGDLDRAAGVLGGQLGIPARYAQYGQMQADAKGKILNGQDSYEIIVPANGLIKNDQGYWTMTIYSSQNRFLIPNIGDVYYISSYNVQADADGTYRIHINPEGTGVNAIPSNGVDFYGVFRVYEPLGKVKFPSIKNISEQ